MTFRMSLSLLFLLAGTAFGQVSLKLSTSAADQGTSPRIQTRPANPQPATLITLDDAINLAVTNSPSIKAALTQITQSKAQEVTANLRPNPVLSWDTQFIPIFSPGDFSTNTLNNLQQFDVGIGYLFERGHKRQNRLKAAQDATAVTESQVADMERGLAFNVAQQFINVLLANSNLQLAHEDLNSFQQTVTISEQRYKAGDISEGDLLKIQLQLLQFQTDVTTAQVAKVQALGSLRQLIGYSNLPRNYDVAGDLNYQPLTSGLDDLLVLALKTRPDLRAAQQGITTAQSQVALAKADAKVDLNASMLYSHVGGVSSTSLFFNIPLPVFNRNQGEIARTRSTVDQAQFTEKGAEDTVMTDVTNAYEAAATNQEVVKLYTSGYLTQAQKSRDISEYAYKAGAAALLDFLDAQRSYRATQLAYRQALAAYMVSLEQLRQAVGTRNLP